MSLIILCVGKSAKALGGLYNSAEFDAAMASLHSSEMVSHVERRINADGRILLLGEGRLARSTVEKALMPMPFLIEPLLNDIQVRSFNDSAKRIPFEKWVKKAAQQRRSGDPRQPETRADVIRRADLLIEKLESDYQNAFLISYPIFLSELLDRFRIHNYVIQRTGLFRIEPLERIVVSRKDEHCGGCQHNCFLSNPGCGIGRDKAMRKRRR